MGKRQWEFERGWWVFSNKAIEGSLSDSEQYTQKRSLNENGAVMFINGLDDADCIHNPFFALISYDTPFSSSASLSSYTPKFIFSYPTFSSVPLKCSAACTPPNHYFYNISAPH